MPGSDRFVPMPGERASRVFSGSQTLGRTMVAMSHTMIEAQRTDDGEALLVLSGDVDLSSVGVLWDVAAGALAGRPQRLVVDMSAVTFLNSSVLGTLIRVQSAAAEKGIDVVLRRPTPIVQRLLRLSGLEAVLTIER